MSASEKSRAGKRGRVPNIVVVGGQWGDEGKGKVVDLLSGHFQIVARWQGGPNAGHTVRAEGRTISLHQVPSGLLHDGVIGVLGNGMVIDPPGLLKEIESLDSAGFSVRSRIRISNRAHVILPLHRLFDQMHEDAGGAGMIGTTRRGIGPAYASKAARLGLRMVELEHPEMIAERLAAYLGGGAGAQLREGGHAVPAIASIVEEYAGYGRQLAPFIGDTALWLDERMAAGDGVLFEGAQGAMLDVDLGTYPFVTSSTTVTAGLGAGLGVGPSKIGGCAGVFKAYSTRVGQGPLPTELTNETGELIRQRGREYGTTTGRPRRCGWFDGVAARYAARINGLDAAALTLFDVLDPFEEIPVCVAYRAGGREIREFPAEPWLLQDAQPVYEVLPGWRTETSGARELSELPSNARRYVDRIESLLGCEIGLVSVGPDRSQTLLGPGAFFRTLLAGAGANATG